MSDTGAGRMLVLIDEAAISLQAATCDLPEDARVFVAGRSLVRMTLAELALPDAEMIWTDFRQSASMRALHAAVLAAGGLDRMVLTVDGRRGEAVFSAICAILTFLPALRRREHAAIRLFVEAGEAMQTLYIFLDRIGPRLAADAITVDLTMLDRQDLRLVA